MKKRIATIIVAGLCMAGMVAAQAQAQSNSVTVEVEYAGSEIVVRGTIPVTAEEKVLLRVYKEGGSKANKADIAAVDEVFCNNRGEFIFEFGMDDERFGNKTENGQTVGSEFVVEIGSKSGYTGEVTFTYINSESRKDVFELLKDISSENELKAFVNKEENKLAFLVAGVDVESYLSMNDSEKNKVIEIVYKNCKFSTLSGDAFVGRINSAIAIVEFNNNKTNAEDVLQRINPTYGTESWTDILAEGKTERISSIKNSIANSTYSDVEDFNEEFLTVCGLYDINNARVTDFEKILNKTSTLLGFDDNSSYEKYIKLSQSEKDKVNAEIIKALSKTPANDSEDITTLIKDKIAESDKKKPSSGGGGGGGGGASYTYSFIPQTQVNVSDTLNQKTERFSDIGSVAWAKESINDLVDKGIISGYPDGTFCPNNAITRAEFVKIIMKAIGRNGIDKPSSFADVPNDFWAAGYIAEATELGIIQGVGENIFAPNSNITRQDMAVMICRLEKVSGLQLSEGEAIAFADGEMISEYAVESVNKLSSAGIINGDQNMNFNPRNNLTRAEASKVIYNLFK